MLFSLYSDREKPPPPGGVSFLVGFRNRHEGRGKTSSFLWKNCGCFFHGGSYCSWLLSWKPPIKETPPDLGGGEFCRSTLCHLDSWLGSPRWKGIRTYDMTHLYVTWLIHTWHDSFTRGMAQWNMIHMYRFGQSDCWFVGVTWRMHMLHDSATRDMTYSYVTWLIDMRFTLTHWYKIHMTHSYVWHGPLVWGMTHSCDMAHWYTIHMTHSYVWHDPFI